MSFVGVFLAALVGGESVASGRRTRSAWILAALALVLGGCDAIFGGGGSSGLVVGDGGAACAKDPEVLSALLARPVACATTGECPSGAYCDLVAGRCDWDCIADSDCGSGFACSCEGQCVGEDGLSDAGAAGDPSCPRNLGILADIGERECLRDEHCAVGSRCDAVTRHCTVDCMADSDCGAGTVCDCRGACVVSGSDEAFAPTHRPTTTVAPATIVVPPAAAWGVQTLSIRIESPRKLPPGATVGARVQVLGDGAAAIGLAASSTPGESVEAVSGIHFSSSEQAAAIAYLEAAVSTVILVDLGVTYDVASRIADLPAIGRLADLVTAKLLDARALQRLKTRTERQAAVSCSADTTERTLTGTSWVVDPAVPGFAATASVAIQRCGSEPVAGQVGVTTYLVIPGAAGAAATEQLLDYRVVDVGVTASTDDRPTPATGSYRGRIFLAGPGGGEPLVIPVDAWAARSDALVLFDRLALATAGDPIVLGAQPTFVVAVDPAGNGARGKLTARISAWSDQGGRNGKRTGSFELTFGSSPGVHRASYELHRVGDGSELGGADSPVAQAVTCSASKACPSGATCLRALASAGAEATAGRCVAGTVATATELTDTIEHPTEKAWRLAGAFLDTLHTRAAPHSAGMHTGERALCYAYRSEQLWNADEWNNHPLPLGGTQLATPAIDWWADAPVDPATGELRCVYGSGDVDTGFDMQFTPTAVPVSSGRSIDAWLASMKHPVATTVGQSARDQVAACLRDLARAVPTVDPIERGGTISDDATLRRIVESWFGTTPGSCINLAQVFPALGSFARGDVDSEAAAIPGDRAAGLLQRLLAQWLDVHAFVLQQGAQESEATAALGVTDGATGPAVDLGELLTTAERGWDLLLDRSYTTALAVVPTVTVRDGDYRAPRPSAYYSFDAAHMTDKHVVDLVGDHHLDHTGVLAVDGTGARVTSNGSATLRGARAYAPVGDATVAFWLDTSRVPAGNSYIVYSAGAIDVRIAPKTGSTTLATLTVGHGAPYLVHDFTKGAWTHFAVVRVGSEYNLYVNGTYTSRLAFTTRPSAGGNPTTLVLSAVATVTIDELSLWQHSLSGNDVYALFNRGRVPSNRLAPLSPEWTDDVAPYAGERPDHDQHLGLATKIVETAASHAGVLQAYAERSLAGVYGSCYAGGTSTPQRDAMARTARGLRYLTAATALASDLHRRGSEVSCTANLECALAAPAGVTLTCGTASVCVAADGATFTSAPAWDAAYRAAATRLAATRGRAIAALGRLERCENPLGIPEDDLPLYFGDVTGDNARFFASSDYLMDRWALPAVREASAALADARTAWQSMRQSNIQQTMTEHDAERRMEGLVKTFVQPIVDACGLTGYDPADVIPAFDRGDLSVMSCFRFERCSRDSGLCMRGQMGSAMLDIKAAANALRQEKRNQERRQVELDAQVATCERVQTSVGHDLEALANFKAEAEELRRKMDKGFAGRFGGLLDSVVSAVVPGEVTWFEDGMDWLSSCLGSAFSGAATGAAMAAPAGGVSAIGGAVIGGAIGCYMGVEGEAKEDSARDLDEARDHLNEALTSSSLLRETNACWDEVNRRLRDVDFGIEFAKEQIIALEQSWFRFDELRRSTERSLAEARAVIAREEGRTVPSVAHHFWTDEKIARFQHEMAQARRMTFLAMRAVEFELQQSLGLRSAILSAAHPDELEVIAEEIDAERGARSLNGRRPAAGTEVLSLRSDILGLRDLGGQGPGERTDSATRRLQEILTSPDYAVWNDDGSYLGQAIPFRLSEAGALRHRCAERLWRVSATVQGDITDIAEPGTHILLRKSNVFQSQWCEGMGDGSPYQQASTSHTANLLRADDAPGAEDRAEFTNAVLFPWFNVRRSDFYRDAYTEGSSEEMAGRGLYGEYVLVFPYHGMLEPDPECNRDVADGCADPFRHLRQVEDVLIRFDYYSVDDLAN